MIEIKNINIKFDKCLLTNANLTIRNKSMVAITGKSGSGKSSLLYMLGLISSLNNASYCFEGVELSNLNDKEKANFRKSNIGFIFQDNNLIDNLNVLENLEFCAEMAQIRISREEQIDLLKFVGLADDLDKCISNLSGGEKQRLAVACALSKKPKLILADEPTSSLDTVNAELVLTLLKRIVEETGTKVVVVTHNNEIAMRMDEVYIIEDELLKCIKDNSNKSSSDSKQLNANYKTNNLSFSFYRRYSKKLEKTGFLSIVILFFCALSIALSVLSFNFGSGTVALQTEYMNTISKNQVFVINQSFPSSSSLDALEFYSMSQQDLNLLEKISGLESIYPFVSFPSNGFELTKKDEIMQASIILSEDSKKEFIFSQEAEDEGMRKFSILPYYKDQNIHKFTQWTSDDTNDKSIYISHQLASQLGIDDTNNSVEMRVQINIPVFLYDTQMNLNGNADYLIDIYIYKQVELTLKVDGVTRNDIKNSYDESGDNNLYMPIESMLQIIEDTKSDLGDYRNSEFYTKEVDYSSYILFSKDFNDIVSIISKIENINPNFAIVSEYQDVQTMQKSITMVQRTMLSFSVVFLLIIVILMSILFINSTLSKKLEIAVLKANGLSQQELMLLRIYKALRQIIFTVIISTVLSVLLSKAINHIFGLQLLIFSVNYLISISILSVFVLAIPSVITIGIIARVDSTVILRNS